MKACEQRQTLKPFPEPVMECLYCREKATLLDTVHFKLTSTWKQRACSSANAEAKNGLSSVPKVTAAETAIVAASIWALLRDICAQRTMTYDDYECCEATTVATGNKALCCSASALRVYSMLCAAHHLCYQGRHKTTEVGSSIRILWTNAVKA